MLYTITGDGASYAQLKEVAEALRKRLQRVPDVTKVDLYGDQGERIFVEFSHAKLATLGVPVQALLDSLAKQNALAPAGEFQTDAQRVPLRVSGAVEGVAAVEETPVFANGQTFRLGDIATVTHGYEDPPSYLIRANGQPALEVGVVMQKGGNILALGKALDATLADFEADAAAGRRDRRASPISPRWSTPRCSNSRARSSRRWRSCSASASSRSAGARAWWSRPRCRWCWRSCSSR